MTITGFHWASLGHDPVMVLFISRSAWAPRPPSLFEVPSQGTSPGRVMVMLLNRIILRRVPEMGLVLLRPTQWFSVEIQLHEGALFFAQIDFHNTKSPLICMLNDSASRRV